MVRGGDGAKFAPSKFCDIEGLGVGGGVWRISRKHCLPGAGALAREVGGGWDGIFAYEVTAKIVTARKGCISRIDKG